MAESGEPFGLREDHKVALADLAAAREERDQYRRWWEDAERVRAGVESVLDDALGTEEHDGAGAGLIQDVRYALAVARQGGCAELTGRVGALADEWASATTERSTISRWAAASRLRRVLPTPDRPALDAARGEGGGDRAE